MGKSTNHPGFKAAMGDIERKEGVSKSSAARILGADKARASEEAREKNPRLNNTPGHKKR